MDIQNEIILLQKSSKRFRKNKNPKSRWPVDYQLRVLRLIDLGLSPQSLSKKLNIPVQTYYHWRRVWKNRPKKGTNFIELEVSDKLDDLSVDKKEVIHIMLPKGGSIDVSLEVFESMLSRGIL